MPDKKNSSRGKGKLFYHLLLLIPHVFSLLNNVTRLIKHEAYLAGKNIVLMIILAIMFACLLTSTWISILAIVFIYLIKLQLSYLSSAIIILILNIVLLFIVSLAMSSTRNKMFFPETRRQLCGRRSGKHE